MLFSIVNQQPLKMVTFECASSPFYGGIMAGASGIVIGLPLSFIKTNYQTNDNYKFGIKNNLYGAWKYEVAKEMVGNMMFLTTYGYLRKYNNYFGNEYVGTMNFANGMMSSILTTFVAYPLDLIKVRKQTIQQNEKLGTIFKSIVHTNNESNFTNLWKGITPVFIRISFFGGVGMYVYEKVRSLF